MGSVEEGGLGAGRTLLNQTARRSEQFVSISVADLLVGRRSAVRPGLDFASVGQASDSGSGRTWRTSRPVDSADHTCWDHSVCHHVSLMGATIEQPSIRWFVPANQKQAAQFKCGRLLANYRDLCLQLPPRAERHIQHMYALLPLSHPECDSTPLRFP